MNKYRYAVLLSLFCFLLNVKVTCTVDHMCANQEEAIRMLGSESSFNFFSINLSEIEKDDLNKLKLGVKEGSNAAMCNYNWPDPPHRIFSFLEALGNDHELSQSVATTLKKIVDDIICVSGKKTAWVDISVWSVNDCFNIPRWHTDDYPNPPDGSFIYKVAVTLKGPCTLLYDLPENHREHFNKIRGIGTMEARQELVKLLNDSARVHVPPLYVGTAFIIGSLAAAKAKPAVHSEPRTDSERIFISVIPMNP